MKGERSNLKQRLREAAQRMAQKAASKAIETSGLGRAMHSVAGGVLELGRKTRSAAEDAAGFFERLASRLQSHSTLPPGQTSAAGSTRNVRPPTEGNGHNHGEGHDGTSPDVAPAKDAPFETETMADLYVRQGLFERAARILETLLAKDPGNRSLAVKLADVRRAGSDRPGPSIHDPSLPSMPSSPTRAVRPAADPPKTGPATSEPPTGASGSTEPLTMLDLDELPRGYDEDVIVLLPVDPEVLYCYYELTADAVDAARAQVGAGPYSHAPLVLRLHRTVIGSRGPEVETSDHEVSDRLGSYYFRLSRPGGRARVAIGVRGSDGKFAPATHSELIAIPAAGISSETREEWLEVEPAPARRRGSGPWPVRLVHKGPRGMMAVIDPRRPQSYWSEGRWFVVPPSGIAGAGGALAANPAQPPQLPTVESRPHGASEWAPALAPKSELRFLGASETPGAQLGAQALAHHLGSSPGSSPFGGGASSESAPPAPPAGGPSASAAQSSEATPVTTSWRKPGGENH